MATEEEIIYEDFLFKLSGNKGKSIWNKNNPWKQRYFILKRSGEKPVLEYYTKKPKNKNATPKDKVLLWPSYRLEKVTNTRHRAYVFEVTTQEKYLCLSADEQRCMDMFVFILQSQMQLKNQIKEDLIIVQPENSEAQRRIGARGTNCILHVSPWGVTLALQSSRSVLAQWPMKSVRYFEASGQGMFTLEAGRVAPMGDGTYVFNTQKGKDNYIYDILDQNIVNALGRTQPTRRGTTEEMEDYVIESDHLSALTTITPRTMACPELPKILQENWNHTVTNIHVPRPRPVVHTRQISQDSQQQNQDPVFPPPLPNRRPSDNQGQTVSSSGRKPQGLPANQSSSSLSQHLADRPPLPPPSGAHSSPIAQNRKRAAQTKPLSIPKSSSAAEARQSQAYLRMDSSSSFGKMNNSLSQFSPSAMNMTPPPTYPEATAYSPMEKIPATRDGYLEPRNSAELAAAALQENGVPEHYILPTADTHDAYELSAPMRRGHHHSNSNQEQNNNFRLNRLRSASCEEINATYSGGRVLRERTTVKDCNQNDQAYDLAKPQPPFKNLHDFRGSIEMLCDNKRTSLEYYNINGLKGTVDSSPAPTVTEVRRRFNEGAKSDTLTRSVSNPNFFNIQKKERLSDFKTSPTKNIESQTLNGRKKSKSLLNLFKKSGRDKSASRSSSHGNSMPSSPTGTLTRQTSIPMISIGGNQVFITERTRSFRRPKPKDQQDSGPNSNRSSQSSSAGKSPSMARANGRLSHSSVSPQVNGKETTVRKNSACSLPLQTGQGGNTCADNRSMFNTHSLDRSGGRTTRYVVPGPTSPPLPKRDRSESSGSGYVNVIHSRSSSDSISSRATGTSMQRAASSSSNKEETVC